MSAQRRQQCAPRGALVAGLILTAVACGSGSTPADRVPSLESAYSQIRTALASDHPQTARRHLRALVDQTTRAVSAGDLSGEQGDRILAAAAKLLTALPAPQPSPSPAATAPAPTTPSASEPREEKPDKEDDDKPGKGRGPHGGYDD